MDILSLRLEALKIAATVTMEPKTPERVMETAKRFMELIEHGHGGKALAALKGDFMDEKNLDG